MTGLGWIHFSDTTRRQVLKIIDLLGEAGAIDELGIGVVRNAFSNEMFKGVTTIMTRARYFYVVPYLMIDYLRGKQREPVSSYMNKAEMGLLEELTSHSENPEQDRIIGHTIASRNNAIGRRKDELVRKPSEIYWGGIREYRLFKKDHSFRQLCDAIDKGSYVNKSKDNRGSENESGDDNPDFEKWSEIFDVPYQSSWNRQSMNLTQVEAEHLRGQIIQSQEGKFLARILENPDWIEEFLALDEFSQILDTYFYKQLEGRIQKIIKTASQFWELLYGAHIRYNILIQDRPIQSGDLSFQEKWEAWVDKLDNDFNWDEFDRSFLWEISDKPNPVKSGTRQFVDTWLNIIQIKKYHSDLPALDDLVRRQEEHNKKDRSKLRNTHTDVYKGWVGIDRLEYRLGYVQVIVNDIAKSLGYI